jgi:HTH-type transcriptional regulator/antitoxin HigA
VHYPIEAPDPIEAILYYMDTRGLSRRDLEPYLGSRARVSEVLSRKRSLTLDMIRKLNQYLGIPAEILIQPYKSLQTPA